MLRPPRVGNGSHHVSVRIFSLVLEALLCRNRVLRGIRLVFSRLFPRANPSPSLIGPKFF